MMASPCQSRDPDLSSGSPQCFPERLIFTSETRVFSPPIFFGREASPHPVFLKITQVHFLHLPKSRNNEGFLKVRRAVDSHLLTSGVNLCPSTPLQASHRGAYTHLLRGLIVLIHLCPPRDFGRFYIQIYIIAHLCHIRVGVLCY